MDMIDRQAAIQALADAGIINYGATGDGNGMIQAINVLKGVPSAQSERKKGKWIPDESGNFYWICSACGFASEAFGADILYHFCPNCGADMREGAGQNTERNGRA